MRDLNEDIVRVRQYQGLYQNTSLHYFNVCNQIVHKSMQADKRTIGKLFILIDGKHRDNHSDYHGNHSTKNRGE